MVSNIKKNLETQIKTHKVNISPILIASKKGVSALELKSNESSIDLKLL